VGRRGQPGFDAPSPVIRCRILGPLEVIGANGADETPAGALQRRLLGALLLHRDRPVTIDALAEVLWPDRLPVDHAAAIQTHVFRLRRRLPGVTIEQQPPGYRLRSDGIALDVEEFETVLSRATALRGDDPNSALELLEEASAMWRGQPFDDLSDCHEAAIESRRLEELRLRVAEERCAVMLELDLARQSVIDLESLVAREPLRERPRELLMRALAATGRPADALRSYEEYRRELATELGIDP
jgi:DNA-binding SARP family transcriptional activator